MLQRQQFYLNFTLHCLTSLAHYAPWWAIGSVREQCIIPNSSADWASYRSEYKDLLWVRCGDLDYDGCILAPCGSDECSQFKKKKSLV